MLKRLRAYVAGTALVAVALLVAPPLSAADGLTRFHDSIKSQIPPEALKYKSARALGDSGFVLEEIVLTPPPDAPGGKVEPIAIKRIAVEDFDFDALDNQAPPNFARIRIEGIAISGKPADAVDLKEMVGIDKLTADFQLDYKLDPERETFTLSRLEIDLNGLARLELTMVLDGVSPDMIAAPDDAMDKTTLRTASLVYEDRSLLAKIVPAVAKLQGGDAAAFIATGKTMLEGLGTGQGPETEAVFKALGAFLDDYQNPKGALRFTVSPSSKTSAAILAAAASPGEVIKAIGLVVSYAK